MRLRARRDDEGAFGVGRGMRWVRRGVGVAVGLGFLSAATVPVPAQETPVVHTEPLVCVGTERNGVVEARVDNVGPDTAVRLYFRRLGANGGGFYWVPMRPRGKAAGEDGFVYWTVLPRPESRPASLPDVEELLQPVVLPGPVWVPDTGARITVDMAEGANVAPRAWIDGRREAELEVSLSALDQEPVEYLAAAVDSVGAIVAVGPVRFAPVREECLSPGLDPVARGWAETLTVGETEASQRDEPLRHWLQDGVDRRIGLDGVPRADPFRACVVAGVGAAAGWRGA